MRIIVTLSHDELATVTGGDAGDDPALVKAKKITQWYGNVLNKGMATGGDLAGKGFVYGGIIGAGGAAASGVGLPAIGLAAWGGAKTGSLIGMGLGFAVGAGTEAYRTWHDRP